MIDLKAAAEAAKAATAAYIADPTDRETGRQWDRACAEFSLACTEDAILALYAERDEARASLEREYQNVCTVTRHLAEATKRAEAAEAAMGEPASHPLNTSAVVSHETANVSDKAATRKEALQVEAIRQAILDNCWGDSNGNVNGSHDAAKAIASLYASPRPEAEIARLTEARRKDAEAFESLRNANTIVRDRAKAAEELVERYRIALADAIRRPMGVTPDSAVGLVTTAELDAAEERRPRVAEGASRSPSEIVVHGDFAVVALSRGLTATIDAADVPLVEGFRWSALTNGQTGHAYAARWDKGRCVLMHRVLLAAPPGTQVDHIDGDGLNNRRVNIRICTPEQNQANRVVDRRNQIGMKGVSPRRGKYRAQITPDGKTVDLGTYKTAEEAAAAYRGAARILWGDFAKE